MEIKRLIQVYDTFLGEKYNAGFNTFTDMVKFWKGSLNTHAKLFQEIVIYTDEFGYNKIKDLLSLPSNVKIEVIEFRKLDSRYWMKGKFDAYLLQDVPFLYCDVDVVIEESVQFDSDVVCEFIRGSRSNPDYIYFGIAHKYVWIPASGIIGFTDVAFAKQYANSTIGLMKKKRKDYVTYETLFTLEEAGLAQMVDINNKTLSEISVKYIHLRDRMK